MDSKRTTEQAEAPGALTPEERRERAARKALQKDTAAWLVKGGIKPRTPEQRKETQAMVDAFLAERGFSLSRPLPPSGHSPQADVHLMAQLSLERIRPAQVIAEGYAVRTGLSAAEAMQELRSAADGRAIGGMYLHTRTDAEGVELWSMMPYQPLSMRAPNTVVTHIGPRTPKLTKGRKSLRKLGEMWAEEHGIKPRGGRDGSV